MRKTLKLFCISGFLFSSRTLCKLENYLKNEYEKENSFNIINNKVEKEYDSRTNNNVNIDRSSDGRLELLEVKEEALLNDKNIQEQEAENNINFEEKILHKNVYELNKERIEKEGLYKPNTIKNIEDESLYKKGKLNFLYEYGMELLNINKVRMNKMNNSRSLGDSNMSFLDISNNNNKNKNNNMNNLNSLSFVDMKSVHRCITKRKKGEKDWACNDKNTKEPNICVSDRRVQLCTGNLVDLSIDESTKEKFKEKLIIAAKREGTLLFEKFGKEYTAEFCLNLKWSYSDYGDIIKGTDMEGVGRSIKVEFEIDRIFKSDQEKSKENRKKWWDEISVDIWNAMIEEHKGKLPKEIKECSENKPSDEPQINRWLMEWAYDTDYHKDKWYKKLDDPNSKCNSVCPKEQVCKSECTKYKTWVNKKNSDFTILSATYVKYNKTNLSYKTAFEYLQHKWDKYNELNFGSIFDQLNAKYYNKCVCQNSRLENNALFVKIENICKNKELKSIYGQLYCKEKGDDKIWQCVNENIKDFPDVCGPPRRQQLCLGNLDKDQFKNVSDLRVFLNEIILGIKDEGKYLIEKYRRNMHENKYLDNRACKYLNYSFDDYKNIILGKDMWRDPNSIKTENILKGNFEAIKANIVRKYPGYADLSLDEFRKHWWDQNKSQLWEAISCEFYTNNHIGVCLMEDDDDNQYLHWFREWKNDFCIEKPKWNNVIKEPCINRVIKVIRKMDNAHDVDAVCKRSCTDYDDWIINKLKEYKKQSSKYKRDRSLYNDVIKNLKPWEYLSMKCTECTCDLDTETFVYPYKGYENKCSSIVKPYDPKDIEDEQFNNPSMKVKPENAPSKDVTEREAPGVDVLSIKETVHLEPFKPNDVDHISDAAVGRNTKEGGSSPRGESDIVHTSTETHTHHDGVSASSSSLDSSSRSDGLLSGVEGVDVDQQELGSDELLSSQTVTHEVTESEGSILNQHGNEPSQTRAHLDGESVSIDNTEDTEHSSITPHVTHEANSLSGGENQETILGERESVTTSSLEDESSTIDRHSDRTNIGQVSDVSVDSSSETEKESRSGLETEQMEGAEVNGLNRNNDMALENDSVERREDENADAKERSGDGAPNKEHLNASQGKEHKLESSESPENSKRADSGLESQSNKLSNTSHMNHNDRIETTGERSIDGSHNGYGHDRSDNPRHRMNINNRSRQGPLESDIVVRGDYINNHEGEEEDSKSTLNDHRNNLNNMHNRTYNIEEYIYRDVNKVAHDIMKSYKSNGCTNDLSSAYCSNLKKESLSNVCTNEDSRNICCSISDYCMKFFNFNSSGYYSCMKKEFANPEYKCFARKGFSNMYYFAGGGLFFIILFLLGTTSSIGKWSEENELNGTAFEEANFEDAAFEVTTGQDSGFEEYGDNAYRIGLLMNQKIQSAKSSDYLEYHMDN
ncbi:erythrocyte binding antigen-165, putative [Plasmodium sp. gorilla clade G2]|uniref:erythrocyte binding antigen-165, putative n=1 Tax=Plasmodium sp. gorilla clade G2 TaxID=880535 RepID=UPI000D299919|nr:erythrocyte binding antigen-165, putative [Plasmodium sp. gorilla clade G2]SOV20040.1 erythrocyte binding antigen-165, putative [Plasmodium sp. gorilla clade G2]